VILGGGRGLEAVGGVRLDVCVYVYLCLYCSGRRRTTVNTTEEYVDKGTRIDNPQESKRIKNRKAMHENAWAWTGPSWFLWRLLLTFTLPKNRRDARLVVVLFV
jgi:hypothetical protein